MLSNVYKSMRDNTNRYQNLQQEKQAAAPLCACGCGQKVLWNLHGHSYRKYLFNHHQKRIFSEVLSPRQEQIVRGTLLGDGSLSFIKSRKGPELGVARLRVRHSTVRQKDYTWWLYEELRNFTSSPPKEGPNKGFGERVIAFSTCSTKQLYQIGKEIYSPVKGVTWDYLQKLDDLGLAIWFMDDGSTTSFATHSFTVQENEIIQRWFKERWNLECLIQIDERVNKPFIRFRQPNVYKLHKIVFPHVLPSLRYKFKYCLPYLLAGKASVSEGLQS